MPRGKDYENIPPITRRFVQCRWKPQIATHEAGRQQPMVTLEVLHVEYLDGPAVQQDVEAATRL